VKRPRQPHSRRNRPTGPLFYPLKPGATPLLVDTRQMEYRYQAMKGRLEIYADLESAFLHHNHTVIVYLPPSYAHSPYRHYPVLYAHDGNNLFDPATAFMGREWRLDETLERLFQAKEIPEMIVVGIYNSPDRLEEYTWHTSLYNGYPCGGKGQGYARFIVEELKPWIDHHFRSMPQAEYSGLMGSSLGAIISFYIARAYPSVFSRLALMSPTVYWAQHQILKDCQNFPLHLRLWVDIGTEEGWNRETEETVESTQEFVHALEARGYSRFHNLAYDVDWYAGHDEMAWGKRVHKPLQFLFGDLA
jgi:predicted alpha/beta superfamily hydrolase